MSEAFYDTLRRTAQVMDETAARLREVALRMDSRGEMAAKQAHEQAQEAEIRARRIKELLETRPRWPRPPAAD